MSDRFDHLLDRLIQTNKYRARDDIVPDVEFRDLRDRGEGCDVAIVEAVTGSDDEA